LCEGWRFSTAGLFVLVGDHVFASQFRQKLGPRSQRKSPIGNIDRRFSLSSEATAEGKFGRVAGNTGIRCRQPAVGSGQPPSF
jgi:hypothetical protein